MLQLGNPQLCEVSTPLEMGDLEALPAGMEDLHDTLMDFRRRHSAGRGNRLIEFMASFALIPFLTNAIMISIQLFHPEIPVPLRNLAERNERMVRSSKDVWKTIAKKTTGEHSGHQGRWCPSE